MTNGEVILEATDRLQTIASLCTDRVSRLAYLDAIRVLRESERTVLERHLRIGNAMAFEAVQAAAGIPPVPVDQAVS